ncbi:hypothetical protein [uncultured Clostridium sp.]|uniref:hypothetical protein n=1 Tax=uncultured Clostridium sp. TaxID=59620 RepID=UPI0028ED0546|nr:hypothetical protein [uncultured Clostridium sp.]
MVYEFLRELKTKVGEELFINILKDTTDDIKFNRVSFGKTTPQAKFIEICKMCTNINLRLGGKNGSNL